jgi:hypothetical protein
VALHYIPNKQLISNVMGFTHPSFDGIKMVNSRKFWNESAVDPSANLLTVKIHTGGLAQRPPRRLADVGVYRKIVREFSIGGRIQFTAPSQALYVANSDLWVPSQKSATTVGWPSAWTMAKRLGSTRTRCDTSTTAMP